MDMVSPRRVRYQPERRGRTTLTRLGGPAKAAISEWRPAAGSGGLKGAPVAIISPIRSRLKRLIAERSFATGSFKLSSGGESSFYFNLKSTLMNPEGAALAAETFLAAARPHRPDYIAGREMGAVPSLGAIAVMSFQQREPIGTVFVRKQRKGHGTTLRIEGLAPGETLAGRNVLVIDDVASQGQSILDAAEAVREAGGIVTKGLVLVDREGGASALLKEHGIDLISVFKASEFGR